jgi:hypothetical protein
MRILNCVIIAFLLSTEGVIAKSEQEHYGVDITFPVHHYIQKDSHFKRRYERWMQGCYDAFTKRECDATERARLEMSMTQTAENLNYTEIGFKKAKIPGEIYKEILAFWNENKVKGAHPEKWGRAYTYVNYWESPTEMVSLEDNNLRGGWSLKQRIWNALNPVRFSSHVRTSQLCRGQILSEWIGGKEIEPVSLYGIRIYKRNAFLATRKRVYLFVSIPRGIKDISRCRQTAPGDFGHPPDRPGRRRGANSCDDSFLSQPSFYLVC